MKFLLKLLALFWVVTISACATAPDAPVTDVRSLGLVSAIGNEFQVISVGTTVFQNTNSSGDITDWTLDEIAKDEIKRLLKDDYDIIDVEYNADGIIADYKSDMSAFWNPKFDIAGSLKRNVPMVSESVSADSQNSVDAILIIAPAILDNYGLRGSPELVGPGLYAAQFISRNTMVYIGAQMLLVDGKTLAEKRRRMLLPGRIKTKNGFQECYDCFFRSIENELYAKRFEELTAEQKEAIQTEIFSLLKDDIEYTLKMIGLLQADGSTPAAPIAD